MLVPRRLFPWGSFIQGFDSHSDDQNSISMVMFFMDEDGPIMTEVIKCINVEFWFMLTHWGMNEIAIILLIAFSHTFSWKKVLLWCSNFVPNGAIGSSDNGSTSYWPPGSLHTLGTGCHIWQRYWLFMWIKILCIEYIQQRILYNQVYVWCCKYAKKITVKVMSINNYALLNIQACSFHVFWNTGCISHNIHQFQAIVRSSYWELILLVRVIA